ncbi:MAG: VanW family protein, partial [Nitriliruptoraceae bacterium]
DGAAVGGMTREVLRAHVQQLANDRAANVATFVFEDDEYALEPAAVGYTLDVDASVDAAMARGRSGTLRDIVERINSLWMPADTALHESWDDAALDRWLADVRSEVDRGVFHGDLDVDADALTVEMRPPHDGARVQVDELRTRAVAALASDVSEPIEIPVVRNRALVRPQDLAEVRDQAVAALVAPIVLRANDTELVLEPATIARLIGVRRSAGDEWHDVELAVTPARVYLALDSSVAADFASEPVDARYDIDRDPPVQFDDQDSATFAPIETDIPIDEGRAGTRFDVHLVAAQLTTMLAEGRREAELELRRIEPDLPTELAEDLRPTHLLSTFTTYHAAGQTRVHNIQLLADTINGSVLLPGEQFSINEISGQRTCEKGYRPAGTIIRGELVDTCGGGTSQFGTTTFNAAFFAGVQLDQWKPHSWYISRYPMGREATINYPELDVKFTNTTDGAIIVMTTHTPSSITVSLYGQPIAREVRAELGSPFNRREPTTQVRRTDELYEGEERVLQSAGGAGFTVRVVQTIVRLDGTEEQRTLETTYLPQNRIVERGTRPRPDDEDD